MRQPTPKQQRLVDKFRHQDGHHNPVSYEHYLGWLFGGFDFRGKRVLEIGSGRGLLSTYIAAAGADHVVSLEPEMEGSTSGTAGIHQERLDELAIANCEIRVEDFNEARFSNERFDLILMVAVLNHLYETPLDASKEEAVFKRYTEIASRLRELLSPSGQVIATDACRYCFWTQMRRFGLPKKLCFSQRTIDWKIHQQPSVWQSIFRNARFASTEISYPLPFRLRRMHRFINNSMVNFVLLGEFRLQAHA